MSAEPDGSGCRVLVAQIGARRHYAVPRALHRMGMLETLITDFCANGSAWRVLDRLLPARVRPRAVRRLLTRRVSELPGNAIIGFPFFAVAGLLERRLNEPLTDRWARRNERFARLAATRIDASANAVYAFNGAALELFRAAREHGLRTVLDQTAAPWRYNTTILEAEAEKWPGWEDAPVELDRSGRLGAREEQEWRLADQIICGSEFAARKVQAYGVPSERIGVVPYPSPGGPCKERPIHDHAGPLRVLFVGSLTLRKGLPYLLEAKARLGDAISVRLVGPSALSESAIVRIRDRMEWVGAVPRDRVDRHYRWADVFVLPTLSEGSANVCHEAMAAGLPVITTSEAGSPIIDRRDGLIVPAADTDALTAAIASLAEDPNLRSRLGGAALRTVSGRTFADYAAELAHIVSTPTH